ncbi:MAG: hypothetical protein ACFE68_01790 [Candidatus Hodarchaeota archaeon]
MYHEVHRGGTHILKGLKEGRENTQQSRKEERGEEESMAQNNPNKSQNKPLRNIFQSRC